MPSLHDDWVQAMRAGDHARAWHLCERQLAARELQTRDDPTLPYHLRWVWDGTAPDGKHVLVRCYHGLGDTIQYLRFLPELRRRAASVTLEIQPRLIPLLPAGIADLIVGFDWDHPHAPADCDIEIMELSFALRLPPASCPPPYLQAPAETLPAGTIGLCCASGDWDPERSAPPRLLRELCQGRDCVTLDATPSALPVLNPQGCPFDIVETAALISGCALVITVDTMIAHLAGALNSPVWLMLKADPDWRWSPHSNSSEWYPSARLYCQSLAGDWSSVVQRIAHDLDRLIPAERSSPDERSRMPSRTGVLG